MRHGAVADFDDAGHPVAPDDVPLTDEGRAQALAARELLDDIRIDRVICSGLPRTTETASIVAPDREVEIWPELRELMGSKLSSIPAAVIPHDGAIIGISAFLICSVAAIIPAYFAARLDPVKALRYE